MTYLYEQLSDEAFQQLVQALLVKEMPDVQCFPVGMPDGGRDATQGETCDDRLAFQVKMARKPAELPAPIDWIEKALKGEAGKIARLAQRGYKRYRLISNLAASSHLDTGLMDRAAELLRGMLAPLEMSGDFWWRDDLDRRLDGDFDLKLRFPHLLNGPDIVRLLWEHGDDFRLLARQRDTFDAYMRSQYEDDHAVRFKQIELESTELFDLFIDVPALILDSPWNINELRSFNIDADRYRKHSFVDSSGLVAFYRRDATYTDYRTIPCAELLSNAAFVTRSPLVVVEGAPGQGKTTLSQFLIQLQRARLLQKTHDIGKLDDRYAASPIRMPIKIELRDLALWLRGLDPWDGDGEATTHSSPKTLEAAICAHISRYSGGLTFDVADLRDTMRRLPVLIVLDALDEVANLRDRRNVIENVEAALNRLAPYMHNLQLVVTSRPSAVSGSPTFSPSKFQYLRLAALRSRNEVTYPPARPIV